MTSKTINFPNKVQTLKDPSQGIMKSLSGLMLVFALMGLLSYFQNPMQTINQQGDEPPFLTANRDESQGGKEFIENRMKNAPFLYGVAHIIPAIIWSALIPTQHMQSIRNKHLDFHRISGWLIVISAISLSISGTLFPLYNLSYSDPDLFHVHYLLIPLPSFILKRALHLPYPTFNLQIKFIPFLQLYPLYRAIRSIRAEKSIANHKYWMTLHTVAGYLISIQRVSMVLSMALGWLIFAMPSQMEQSLAKAFNFPNEDDHVKKWEIERSAFALTAWSAFLASAVWIWKLAGKEKLGKVKSL